MEQWGQRTDDDLLEFFKIVCKCAFYVVSGVSERGVTVK